jgi:hypothetical protein
MGLSIDSLVTTLNRRAVEFAPDINAQVRQGLELEAELTPKFSAGDYVAPSMSVTEVYQGFQPVWLPKGTETLTALTITQQQFMANLQWTTVDLVKFWTEYGDTKKFFEANKQPMDWTFPQYFYDNFYIPKMREELNTNSFSGSYVAITPGTAGPSANTVDGWLTTLAALITASKVTPVYVSGAINSGNVLAKLDAFAAALPITERRMGGEIRCSYAMKEMAQKAFVAAYGANIAVANALGMNFEFTLPGYPNIKLKAYAGMGSSSRLIFKPMNFEPMAYVVNPNFGGAYPQGYWFHEPKSGIIGFRQEMSRGYGFLYADRTYVNEQA